MGFTAVMWGRLASRTLFLFIGVEPGPMPFAVSYFTIWFPSFVSVLKPVQLDLVSFEHYLESVYFFLDNLDLRFQVNDSSLLRRFATVWALDVVESG